VVHALLPLTLGGAAYIAAAAALRSRELATLTAFVRGRARSGGTGGET
jgi:hypothetical protein